jgi:hypothetical protein
MAGADEGEVFDPGDIVGIRPVEHTSREEILIELDDFASAEGLSVQTFFFLRCTIDPKDSVRLGQSGHLFDPLDHSLGLLDD